MRRKVFPLTEISLDDRRDLGDRDNFYPIWTQLSRLAGKLSVYTLQNLHHCEKLYPVSGKTFLHMNRTTLFDLSKCFLGNRDNFCPYEQALNDWTFHELCSIRKCHSLLEKNELIKSTLASDLIIATKLLWHLIRIITDITQCKNTISTGFRPHRSFIRRNLSDWNF